MFSPSLFIGATLGAAFASAIAIVIPGAPVSAPAFAMVGMGAMVAGGTGAAITAVAMIFEMTRDYDIVLPMIIAVAFSLGESDIAVGPLAQRNFIVVHENDVAFDVISRLSKQHAVMAVVVERDDKSRAAPARVLGVIAKEHIADAVAGSIKIFPG